MLKKLFGSGARVKLLKQFLMNQDEEFFIRQLTRILDEQINSLRRELQNLSNIGLLKFREKNRKKYYRINTHFPLLHELTSIIRKTNEDNETLLKKMSKLGNIQLCILSGIFTGKQSDIDIFIVGDLKLPELEAFTSEHFKDIDVTCGVMSEEDFSYRITLNDKFILGLFKDKDNLIIKNKIKQVTAELVTL